jgi:hypothetical protein
VSGTPFHFALATSEPINLGLGALSFILGAIAIYLAVSHSREIGRVRGAIAEAQEQTRTNLAETIKVGAQTLDAFGLHEILVTNDHLSASIRNLASDFADVTALEDPFLNNRAHGDIERVRNYIHMAAEGHVTIGPEALAADEQIPSALLAVTEPGDEFWASSVVNPEFWARASAYLQQQRNQIKIGVKIHRVFVFEEQEAFEEARAQQLLKLQADAGIDVYYVIDSKHEAQDLVSIARPGTPEKILYAAEFRISPNRRVNEIHVWSAGAGYEEQVTRLWNSLRKFFDDAEPFSVANPQPTTSALG